MARIVPAGVGGLTIWQGDVAGLGDNLSSAYVASITDAGLDTLADQVASAKGEPGGASAEASDKHFAWRFTNSACRAIYSFLDPADTLDDASNAIASAISDGETVVIDVACGAGAGLLGLVATAAELRAARVLPSSPLRIRVVGADLADRARVHYGDVVQRVTSELRRRQIDLQLEGIEWDASDIQSSTMLIDIAVARVLSADRVLILVSNFSDALSVEGLRERFEHFLSQAIARLSVRPLTLIWLEPKSNKGVTLLGRMIRWFSSMVPWLKTSTNLRTQAPATAFQARDPRTGCEFQSGVTVLRCHTAGLPW